MPAWLRFTVTRLGAGVDEQRCEPDIYAGAMRVFTNVEKLILAADQWVSSALWMDDSGIESGSSEANAEYIRLKHKVVEMKRSWHQGVIGLIQLAGGFGDLRITMDGEYSLYFVERQTGFCGALIYHPARIEGKVQPYGDFSIHT